MVRSTLKKVMSAGRATVFLIGLAVILALLFGVASTALGKNGQALILGKANNTATKVTGLIGKVAAGSALVVKNPSGGSALGLSVGDPLADPATKPVAPMKVDSQAKVANLNSDELDGKSDTDFYAAGSKVADSDLFDGRNSSDFASAYKSTVVVSPIGTPQQNGTALKNALAGITDASATNPYLLKIEPGVYDLGSSDTPLTMKPWVDVEGSGEGVTTLTASGSNSFTTGTVVGVANSELRFLTVKNTGGVNFATAVYSTANPFRSTHVTTHASGGTFDNVGVRIGGGGATLREATFTASGSSENFGVAVVGGGATLSQVSATGSGGTVSYGVIVNTMNNVEIRDSQIVGNTNTVRDGGGDGIVLVGASQLAGGGSAEATCAGVYDENYAFSANTCP